MSAQSTNWCFTLNNWNEWDDIQLRSLDCKYIVLGYEEAPSTGTPHIQGFVQFDRKKRFGAVKDLLPPGTHLEAARGSALDAANYCKKDGCFWEDGVVPRPRGQAGGEANKERWDEVKELAKAGDIDSVPSDIFIRYYGTLRRIAKDYMKKPDPLDGVCGLWIWGDSGTGKTHVVAATYPDRYLKPISKWWDGYQGEDVVHLDEICPMHTIWIPHFLKKWADKWPFDAEVKGGAMQIRPKKFIVTSNYSIAEMGFNETDLPAILRRFTEIRKTRDQNIMI